MPLDAPEHIAAIARSVVLGGATGVRIEGVANMEAVRRRVSVPIIGLIKARPAGGIQRHDVGTGVDDRCDIGK
ncbi:hypothetical protein FJ948_27560, partial [Mesorhizobium sp. B2-3-12]